MNTGRLAAVALCVVMLSTAAAAGWVSPQASGTVRLLSGKRSHIFYAGEPVRFTQKGGPAARYEVRDYYGSVVDRGAAPETVTLNVKVPGWYKLYLYGADGAAESVGGTMFAIFRNDPRFPPLPPSEEPSGDPAQDVPTRSILGIGPERHAVPDAGKPDEAIARLQAGIDMEAKYYLPYDPVRKRVLLVAFPNGTENLDGVRRIVEHFKDTVTYWEPRNEPNYKYSGAEFVEKEMKPFYETVKSVSGKLCVIGPGTVTIGPYGLKFIEDFLEAGGADYLDGFSFHAYNNVNGDVWLARTSLDGLNELLAKYGADKLEKWQTENGYFAAVYGSYQPRLQGRWTMVRRMVFEQYGIPKEHDHYWYDRSHGFWDFPTWWKNEDGGVNPAAPLMRVWSEEVFGTKFERAFDFGPSGNPVYIGSLFTGRERSVAVFMTAGAADGKVELHVKGGGSLRVVSPFGVESTLPVSGGKAALRVAELPVYVRLEKGQSVEPVPLDFGQNLARQDGVVCSHSTSSKDDAGKLNNGEFENWYYAQGDAPRPWESGKDTVYPAWVEMRFPAEQSIGRVRVFAAPPWQCMGTLVDYELQYEKDGAWVTMERLREPVKTFKVITPPVKCGVDSFFSDRWIFLHEFDAVKTAKIRLLIHRVTHGGGATADVVEAGGQACHPQITLREVEVYAR